MPAYIPVPCLHACTKPIPSTFFLRWHPLMEGWEIRRCPECKRDSAYNARVA